MIKTPFSRFIVHDHSMEPGFCEFDRVLTYNWGKLQKGSVVVARVGGRVFIKRVKSLGREIVLQSDNKKFAKGYYKVRGKDVIGRVFLKY